MSSGLAGHWADGAPSVTYEGVNVLMSQQSSRYLMKMVENVKQGRKVDGAFAYLANTKELLSAKGPTSVEEFLEVNRL